MPARVFLGIGLASLLLAGSWLALEERRPPLLEPALLLALALVPAIAVALRRGLALVGAAVVVSTLSAASLAFGIPLTDMRRGEQDFFGPLLGAARRGFLDFYDAPLPFARGDYPLMHSLVLFAVFGFAAAAAALLAARLPVPGAAVLLVGAGWPVTLNPEGRPLLAGSLVLACVLALLFLVRGGGPNPARALAPALLGGLALVALAAGASTSDAVAKDGFVDWRSWDIYDAPEDPVGVRYVWNSHYQGISFPEQETVVLRVRLPEGERRKLYWRATTLDEYTGVGWRERLELGPAAPAEEIDGVALDPLLPPQARDPENWVRQDVTVGALADSHLIASSQPVRWRPGTSAPVQAAQGGVVLLPQALRAGQTYTAWSYVPDPKVSELAEAAAVYDPRLGRQLELVPGVGFPSWGSEGRDALVEAIFAGQADNFIVAAYEPVYRAAREVVGGAKSPYAAAVALEAWFRQSGGFRYEEQPGTPAGGDPPLVDFVLASKAGYCQHYAGAMAVMLRMLGVPARVAAGFTSGTYDAGKREWTVTDHNAHTWVEVYFPGFGWIPFDPTPGRGELSAEYSAVSDTFGRTEGGENIGSVLGGSPVLDAIRAEALRSRPGLEGPTGLGDPSAGGGGIGAPGSAIRDTGRSLVAVAFFLVAAGAAGIVVLKRVRRELRFASREPRALAAACRRDLVGFLADQRVEAPASATISELGELVERAFVVDAGPFVRSLVLARFGPPGETRAALRRARRELRLLRRQMGHQLGAASRLRGALSLRSLAL